MAASLLHPPLSTDQRLDGALIGVHGISLRTGDRAVCESNHAGEGRPEDQDMGQAALCTGTALAVFEDTRREIADAAYRGEITPYRAGRITSQLMRLADALTFAHNRNRVASMALRDVQDARNIAEACRLARISPITFDMGPLDAA
jgi:hypothetical protein